MADIVERLRDGIPTQSCDVRSDVWVGSDVWVRCGRGDCACERQLMMSAAIEIARLREVLREIKLKGLTTGYGRTALSKIAHDALTSGLREETPRCPSNEREGE